LEKGKGGPTVARGLTGEIPVAKIDKPGTFVIEATYTDLGRAPAGNLSGKATVTLRSRRIAAASGEVHGPRITGGGEQRRLGSVDHGHFVRLANLDLSNVGSVTARYSSGNVGGQIELRVGSATGDLIGSIDAPNTGGWDQWTEAKTQLDASAPHARAEVYVVFVNPGKSGLMNLDWLQFNPR
jgi:cytochrome c